MSLSSTLSDPFKPLESAATSAANALIRLRLAAALLD